MGGVYSARNALVLSLQVSEKWRSSRARDAFADSCSCTNAFGQNINVFWIVAGSDRLHKTSLHHTQVKLLHVLKWMHLQSLRSTQQPSPPISTASAAAASLSESQPVRSASLAAAATLFVS
jgi:hypothetical protein